MSSHKKSIVQALRILPIAGLTFAGDFCVGFPLGVLPIYINDTLAMGSLLTGLSISLTPLFALVARPLAGRISDKSGPKQAVIVGLTSCAVSGFLTFLGTSLGHWPSLGLALLLLGRIALGIGLGMIGTGCVSWGIGRVGSFNTAKVISWNGVAANFAMAISAPIGVMVVAGLGYWSLGACLLVVSMLALTWAKKIAPVAVIAGKRMGFASVLLKVSPNGLALALGQIGFGTLITFITLYYHRQGWSGGVYCLSAFGLAFMTARLLFANTIRRIGGYRVGMVSLSLECFGLILLWLAHSPNMALIGAVLTGLGLSLVYPALGVEVVPRIPAANRGSALGAYALFSDLSLGLAGPLMGQIATHLGFTHIFLVAALLALAGVLLTGLLYRQSRQQAAAKSR